MTHYSHTTSSKPRAGGLFHSRVHHQKRRASLGDKISGALLKLKGSLTRRPGTKVSS